MVDAFGDRAKIKMQLRMVYAPPFSEGKLNAIAGLWDEYPWLEGIVPSITYPHPGSVPPEMAAKPEAFMEDKSMMDWAHEKYITDYTAKKESHPLIKGIVVQALIRIFKRPIYIDSMKEIYLNGCCLPAVRKVFVSVNGDFYLCERVNNTDRRFDLKKKRRRCRAHIYSVEKGLELFTTLLKIDPEGLNYIEDMDIA